MWDVDIVDFNFFDSGKEKCFRKKMIKILVNYFFVWRKEEWNGRWDLYVELYCFCVVCILVIFVYLGVCVFELFLIEEDCCVVDEVVDGRKFVYLNMVLWKYWWCGFKDMWVIIDDVVVVIDIF